MRRLSVLSALVVLLLTMSVYAAEGDSDVILSEAILGEWYTDGNESVVEVYKADDCYYGKIVWLKEPLKDDGSEVVDSNNPDESKRTDPISGLNLLSGFEYAGRKKWSGGTIYDPNSGKTYSCKMKLKGDELNIRGYIGISLLGRTTIWTRKESE